MGPRVAEEVGRLDPGKGELVDLVRSAHGKSGIVGRRRRADVIDKSWVWVPEANVFGGVQPVQVLLPFRRSATIVSHLCLFCPSPIGHRMKRGPS